MAAQPPDPAPDSDPGPSPGESVDAERSRRTAGRLLGTCAALTALIGVFQLAGILRDLDQFGTAAWAGVVVALLAELGLIAGYGACAINRATLRSRVIGRLDLFQVLTVLLIIAITAGILIPTRNTTALALLLPWGISYWVHEIGRASCRERVSVYV
jgi:hypothetical protein